MLFSSPVGGFSGLVISCSVLRISRFTRALVWIAFASPPPSGATVPVGPAAREP